MTDLASQAGVPDDDHSKLAFYLKSVLSDCGVEVLQPQLLDYKNVQDRDMIASIATGKQFCLQSLSFKTIFLEPTMLQEGQSSTLLGIQEAAALQPDPLLLGGVIPANPTHVLIVNQAWVETFYIDPVERLTGDKRMTLKELFVRTSQEEQEADMMDMMSKMKDLISKRKQEKEENKFQSFSGQGNSLGSSNAVPAAGGRFDPSSLPSTPPTLDAAKPSTQIAVRLLDGSRQVVKLNLTHSVADLAASLKKVDGPFMLVGGFPPKPLTDTTMTVEAAGLKGAQVSVKKVE